MQEEVNNTPASVRRLVAKEMGVLVEETTHTQLRFSTDVPHGVEWKLIIKNSRGSGNMGLTGVVFPIRAPVSAATTGEWAFALCIKEYKHAIARRERHECASDQFLTFIKITGATSTLECA
jgi:hypothetical protein